MNTFININKIIFDCPYKNEFFEILVDHYNLYKSEGLIMPTEIPKRY